MKEFLKKYLSEEELNTLEENYKKDHPDQQGLPVYVGKKRLDEVLGKQKAAETERDEAKKEIETLKAGNQKAIDEAVKKAVGEAKVASTKEMETLKKDYATNEAIYKANGKNVVAIKALIDPTKEIKDEIERLQKSDPYLFNIPGDDDDLPPGTGKHGGKGVDEKAKELEQMRRAVGVIK